MDGTRVATRPPAAGGSRPNISLPFRQENQTLRDRVGCIATVKTFFKDTLPHYNRMWKTVLFVCLFVFISYSDNFNRMLPAHLVSGEKMTFSVHLMGSSTPQNAEEIVAH